MENLNNLRALFDNPPTEYRSAPFWAWNDKLDEEEMVRQIGSMKEQGMGGFFMHSRDGLETSYMGEEWLNCVKTAVSAAKEAGMKAWLYDEDRWPSGTAGGQIPAKGDAFRAKGLTIEVLREEFIPESTVCALFLAKIDDMSLDWCERLDTGKVYEPVRDGVFLVFRVEVSEPSEWFNNETPPDNMNPDCVKAFIQSSHEKYKETLESELGETVPGIFTDEPSVHDRHCRFTPGRGWIPWTYGFPDFFREKRGYEILDCIPYVFFNGGKSFKARHDFWRTVSELFCDSYTRQLGEWCGENNLQFTGHYLWENALGIATRTGGAIMPHYRYQHVPGVDLLCEQTDETITIKQCTSVANQYGRKFVLSETYGCTGWEFTFEGQKWLGDWQYVMGVNKRCQHLALYSLRGCRKRDYPPVFNYNTSWWKYNHVIEDYFARLGAVLTQGQPVRDILVLHPSSTAWGMLGSNPYGFASRESDRDISEVNGYGEAFNRFIRYLLGIHYDFDLGDETIMSETGKIKEGKLFVNLAGYNLVVIPPVKSILESTRNLLLQFMESGGRVIATEPVPYMADGRESCEMQELFAHHNMTVVKNPHEIEAVLENKLSRRVSIRDNKFTEVPELLYMLREVDNGEILFIVNTDRSNSHDVTIRLDSPGKVEEWDPLTGRVRDVEATVEDGSIQLETSFYPADSKLYIIKKSETAGNGKSEVSYASLDASNKTGMLGMREEIFAALGPVCSFSRTMPNLLVLDSCSYQMGANGWSDEMDLWQAQRKIREVLDMPQVYSNGLLQRYKWIYESHPMDGTPVKLKFSFQVKDIPEGDIYLVIENAEDFQICLNGTKASDKAKGWFLDRSFDRIRLKGLSIGANELVVSCSYQSRMELEDCYVIGDFGVDSCRNISAEPKVLHFGDWCPQGYPHYCGSMVYRFDFNWSVEAEERAVLELGDFSAVTVEIRINGKTAGHIPWRAANRLDITDSMNKGGNRVEIEVMGSPRNMLGPFHQVRGHLPVTDWASFRREGCEYTPEYILQPYGLFSPVKICKVRK